MAEILQRFSGNPFSTPVGQKIEQATDPMLSSENWALNMEICDLINETEDGARDAVRAIKKRLQQNAGKNFSVFMYTLTVLETCVKNCGKRFHVLVTNKDFIQDLMKFIGPKNEPPPAVQERVLSLIQSWAEAFHGQPELQGVSIAYNDFRSKGIQFPKSSTEPKVPIHTPQRSVSSRSPEPRATCSNARSTSPNSANISPPQRMASATGDSRAANEIYPIQLSPEQLNKLKNELEQVQANMKVLSEMLAEMKPRQEHKDDWELLVELHGTCQLMQKRIVELIETVANEEVTNELLRINDELNNLFMRYDRYKKKRGNGTELEEDIPMMMASTFAEAKQLSSKSATSTKANSASTSGNIPSLIDFTEDEPDGLTSDLEALKLSQPKPQQSCPNATKVENSGDQEFDMFAQLRSTPLQPIAASTNSQAPGQDLLPIASTSTSSGPASLLNQSQLESGEIPEIERWLGDQPTNTPSMQFEQYLQKRANALEQQPLKNDSFKNQDSSLI